LRSAPRTTPGTAAAAAGAHRPEGTTTAADTAPTATPAREAVRAHVGGPRARAATGTTAGGTGGHAGSGPRPAGFRAGGQQPFPSCATARPRRLRHRVGGGGHPTRTHGGTQDRARTGPRDRGAHAA